MHYIDAKRGSREELSVKAIQQMIYTKTDELLDISESSMWDGCLKMIKSLSSELGITLKRIEGDNRTDKSKSTSAGLVLCEIMLTDILL